MRGILLSLKPYRWIRRDSISCGTDRQADEDPLHCAPQFRELKFDGVSLNAQPLFLAGFSGLFKSTDFGETWTDLKTLPVTRIMDLAVSAAVANDFCVSIRVAAEHTPRALILWYSI